MRRLMLVAFAAVSTTAHAQALRCRKSLLHPTACASGAVPAPTASAPKPEGAVSPVAPAPQPAGAVPQAAVADPRSFEPYACNLAQKITLGPSTCSARQIAQSHRLVGDLMRQGRCDEAARSARATGDQAYAERIGAICADRRR